MTENWTYPLVIETPTREAFNRVVTIANEHTLDSSRLDIFMSYWGRYEENTCILITGNNRLEYGPKKYFHDYEGEIPRISAYQFLAYYEGMGILARPALPLKGTFKKEDSR